MSKSTRDKSYRVQGSFESTPLGKQTATAILMNCQMQKGTGTTDNGSERYEIGTVDSSIYEYTSRVKFFDIDAPAAGNKAGGDLF